MPKYVITIQQVVDVEAKNEDVARRLATENPPHKDMFGAGPLGAYGLKARKSAKIISCVEKRSRKNA